MQWRCGNEDFLLIFSLKLRIIKVGKVGKNLLAICAKGGNRMSNLIVDNAKVMSKGQITLPKEIRIQLGIDTGDRVTLICDGDQVVMMNAAVYAMKMLQKGMAGEAEKQELVTEAAIEKLVKEVRIEVEGL